MTVAATNNSVLSLGGIASYSNFGEPSEIAAPGNWPSIGGPGMLNGRTDAADISAAGTSFAAPAVAGVAALIASRNLTLYGVPDGAALKIDLLDNHTVIDPDGLALIPSHKGLTMTNLR
ncbi:MAG TPA: S8 family serine peptidase [Kofleriaceae bacterium]|nr:S8 family serine peptidase [Kofleriaceae bacterium]